MPWKRPAIFFTTLNSVEFFLENNWIGKMFRPRKRTSKRMPAHFLNYSCPMNGLLRNDSVIFTNHMYPMEKSNNIFYWEGFFLENNWILKMFRPWKHNIFCWEEFFLENNWILYMFRPRKHNIFCWEEFFLENNWIGKMFRPRKHNIFYWEGFFLENNWIGKMCRPRKPT
jgi:hypothetical protein